MKIEKKQQRLESGLISEHFPGVSSIVITLKNSYGGVKPITVVRTLTFWPDSYAYFNIECLRKNCVDGGFDLSAVVSRMIKSRKDCGEGNLVCNGSNLSSSHSYLTYKIDIQYTAG